MKPGDLVKVQARCYILTEVEPVIRWSDSLFNLGSFGIIIDTRKSPARRGYIKIITPEGLGWILTENIEVLG